MTLGASARASCFLEAVVTLRFSNSSIDRLNNFVILSCWAFAVLKKNVKTKTIKI
jgi:hypothetical protein